MRQITKEDLEKALQILSQLSHSGGDKDTDKLRDVLDAILKDSNYYLNVCEDNGNVIGTSMLYIQHNLSHEGRPRGHIENVVVDRNYRSRGIGRLLLDDLLRRAKERDCYKVILHCRPENIGFYEKSGFRKTGEVEMRVDL
ncbi:GNAT family N-acetyltransferase [Candidatus Pacearchaeota archaeon]|nr:GNAT family N-acetyltransferase [Candidatus Pacearchaeota archaeon]